MIRLENSHFYRVCRVPHIVDDHAHEEPVGLDVHHQFVVLLLRDGRRKTSDLLLQLQDLLFHLIDILIVPLDMHGATYS